MNQMQLKTGAAYVWVHEKGRQTGKEKGQAQWKRGVNKLRKRGETTGGEEWETAEKVIKNRDEEKWERQ